MLGGASNFIFILPVGLETSFFEKQLALFKSQSNLKKLLKFAI
jgi:hypothetical protein